MRFWGNTRDVQSDWRDGHIVAECMVCGYQWDVARVEDFHCLQCAAECREIQPVAPNCPLDEHSHISGQWCQGCADLMGTDSYTWSPNDYDRELAKEMGITL